MFGDFVKARKTNLDSFLSSSFFVVDGFFVRNTLCLMWVLGGIYRLELFDLEEFDKWVAKAMAPAIEASLKLYEEVLGLGFKVFLLTGRSEKQRGFIVKNLNDAGFQNWDKLILR